MKLNRRQQQIVEIVKENGPITGEQIAESLHLTRATLRPDLAILTMAGFLDARPRVGYFYTGKTSEQTENINNLLVKDYYSSPVVASDTTSVYDAIVTMFTMDVGTIFIVDANEMLADVVSRKDMLRASIGKQELSSLPVTIIMTRMPNITYCYLDDKLVDVGKKLIEREIDSLPVVKEELDGLKVIGRVTKTNITKALVDLSNEQI
ncbi:MULTISPECIES: helix-turn-helix transcriptional regulator [unclassified Niallia]|uniref:helix-turn-helix transcriptional regulator n=1 Tax=unclassified Niallia TaxID=2837522 RepID=UPI001EDA953E|nr:MULTISPECIES: helix-turn-helix transcriptional regulator [unclassified Niallia]MDL0436566.1 helix-turn-helix transcriptional regulator [Niallia sp. SS-2023]UPO89599.1 helix-turn-helix transcriptional regulator [Niallia sp. Man26]